MKRAQLERGVAAAPAGQLCAARGGHAQCDRQGGAFGTFVWSLFEDSSGTLWAGAESGVWRWKPGPPRRYETPGMRVGDLTRSDDGHVLIGVSGGGLLQLAGDRLVPYPIRDPTNRDRLFPDRSVDSKTPPGTAMEVSGSEPTNAASSTYITAGQTYSRNQTGLPAISAAASSRIEKAVSGSPPAEDSTGFESSPSRRSPRSKASRATPTSESVLAATDGSIWVAAHDGLTRWKNGRATVFDKANGLPHNMAQSLFQDDRGRIWVLTGGGLAYLRDHRFVGVPGVPSQEVFSMTGDGEGGLWLSTNKGLLRMRDGRLVESFPWSVMGASPTSQGPGPGRCLAGILERRWRVVFRGGKVRASYTPADGLSEGPVAGPQLDR